jgi:hypothetical protein
MFRKLGILTAVVATLAITTTIAMAAVTFHAGPTLVWNSDGSATATGDVSGLGNTPATATLRITTSYTYTCQNKGGNVAPGQTSVTVFGTPGTQLLDNTDHNGRATLSVTAYPGTPATTVSGTAAGCPNGNWKGVNPVPTGPASALLTITQGGVVIYSQTFTQP